MQASTTTTSRRSLLGTLTALALAAGLPATAQAQAPTSSS